MVEGKIMNKINKFNYILDFIAIAVFSGFFGFIYETIFYKIDLGYFVKRGTTMGPWIPIYAFGAILITISTKKFKNKPFLVFLISTFICGLLEFITGYLLFRIGNIRLWDYNTEIWNWGNIGGYICLRSITFFGISGVLLIYAIIPLIKFIEQKANKKVYSSITLTLGGIFLIDILINSIIGFIN